MVASLRYNVTRLLNGGTKPTHNIFAEGKKVYSTTDQSNGVAGSERVLNGGSILK
jgi:hypothetical protein